jgi:2,4-dienoyl-CoA reductase-like NADH-dependent reductase (Old Yellow Enzyme family)
MPELADPLKLPCGASLPNRIAKAAMTEGLAAADDMANERHARLYRRWAAGGAGLLVTGNVMVDRRWLERPGNVVIEDRRGRRRWPRGPGPARRPATTCGCRSAIPAASAPA